MILERTWYKCCWIFLWLYRFTEGQICVRGNPKVIQLMLVFYCVILFREDKVNVYIIYIELCCIECIIFCALVMKKWQKQMIKRNAYFYVLRCWLTSRHHVSYVIKIYFKSFDNYFSSNRIRNLNKYDFTWKPHGNTEYTT